MWAVILSGLLVAANPQVELRTVAGQSSSGTLAALGRGTVTLATSGGDRDFNTKDLLQITLKTDQDRPNQAADTPTVWIDLVDGSRLVGSGYGAAEGKATLKRLSGEELTLPTSAIAAVRLKEQSTKIAAQWADILAAPRASDVIVIRREEAIDYQEGLLGSVTDDTVQFTLDGDVIDVKRPRVEGFIYFQAKGPELPRAICQVLTRDGGQVQAREIALEEGRITVTTPAGVELTQAIERVRQFDFSLGKVRYLSDLEPELVERTPYLGSADKALAAHRYYEPRLDRSFDGGPLRIGTAVFEKGLALKSRTRIVYRLPSDFSRLEAVAGIDASVAPLGDVHLTVGGGEGSPPLFEGDIRGSDGAAPLSVDIEGLKRLVIEVDFGEGGDVGDYLDLGDARIIQ